MKTHSKRPFQWHFAAFFPERPCGSSLLLVLLPEFSGTLPLEYSHFVQAGLATHHIPTSDLQESRAFGFHTTLADRQLVQGTARVPKGLQLKLHQIRLG